MTRRSADCLAARNGHTLIVAIVARISGCQNQKEQSLDDQVDNGQEVIAGLYAGPVEIETIATTGKGERLDRPELEKIEAAYRSGRYDVFVYDDLGRLIRGGDAARLLGVGVDHGTRSICIADGIDTVEETWEEDALSACSENVAHNQRTSKRIKQKMMNRFKKFGATAKRPIAGYIVPEEAKTFDDWLKDSSAETPIREGARILRTSLNGAAVADYFRQICFPVGPSSRNDQWDGTMVLRFYRNPLLKGMPQRGYMATMKHHGTGKRLSRKNPKGPTHYDAPHLAYFDADDFDGLVALLAAANHRYRRKTVNGVDPRANVSRKRTRFPGQHARCWYCGRTYNWGSNGITGHLMCSGSHKYLCWNSIHIDGALVVDCIRAAITEVLFRLEGFDDQFRNIAAAACRDSDEDSDAQLKQIEVEQVQLQREKDNLLSAMKAFGPKQMVLDEIDVLESRERELARRRYLVERAANRPLQLPQSASELRAEFDVQFQSLSAESPEFGNLLRQIVPDFHVYLVRLIDGGPPMPRARVKLAYNGIAPDVARVPALDALLTRVLTIDLFDRPPQRERIRAGAVRLEAEGATQREIAHLLQERPKSAVVYRALALHRKLLSLGLASPYVVLQEPPEDYPKLRRHRHNRYCFTPLDGYMAPDI